MFPPFDFFDHRRACQTKQSSRSTTIASLPPIYSSPLSPTDRQILSKPIEDLVRDVHARVLRPVDILRTYGKMALRAHEETNCLTEVMIARAEGDLAEKKKEEDEDGDEGGDVNLKGPLAGIPISLKDTVVVGGFDVSVGYSAMTGRPAATDGSLVRILRDAGAIPYVKTNLPITLLSFESANDVWGRTTNPHNRKYSPGGSTGGESALLAFGGGRIGIGSDVAGSVRVPAHFSGIYALRCSVGRWPKMGTSASMPGQEGIPAVYSPMARTLDDLIYFSRSLISMEPWRYDHTIHPIPWRTDHERHIRQKGVLRFGVMRTDGVVEPSPACARALEQAASALRSQGHEVFDVTPPPPYEALQIASALLNSDGCQTFRLPYRTGEWGDTGAAQMSGFMRIPRPVKYLYYLWVKYIRQDPIWAGLLKDFHPKSALQQWKLVARREAYKARWHEWWQDEARPDFILTAPNAAPALPHDAMKDAVSSCGYTFLFNLLDYTCGVVPVTRVDKDLDQLPITFRLKRLNGVAKGAYKHYSADQMHGLPVGIQVVGQRLQEERVLMAMKRVEEALERNGLKYKLKEIE